ncbi:MAG: hypothetical protein OSB14_05685 [Planctomycetota bacterium]|nr:hypothetical protein [Planctomycetota bacterium]
MTRTLITTLLTLSAAAFLAWRMGGVEGAGVLIGGLGGASAASVGVLLQVNIAKTAPKRLFGAMTAAFMIKMFAALAGALVFRYVEAAAARADWQTFLISFALSAVIVMMAGIFDLMRLGVLRSPMSLNGGQA